MSAKSCHTLLFFIKKVQKRRTTMHALIKIWKFQESVEFFYHEEASVAEGISLL